MVNWFLTKCQGNSVRENIVFATNGAEQLDIHVHLFMAFVLKSILSDISIATPAFFFFLSSCLEYFFPQHFTFCLCRSFVLRWVFCRQHIYLWCFLIHSATLCLLIGAFNPFTFKVIDKYLFIAILLPLYLCSSLSHSFPSFSYSNPFTTSFSVVLVEVYFFILLLSGKLLIWPSILIESLAR